MQWLGKRSMQRWWVGGMLTLVSLVLAGLGWLVFWKMEGNSASEMSGS